MGVTYRQCNLVRKIFKTAFNGYPTFAFSAKYKNRPFGAYVVIMYYLFSSALLTMQNVFDIIMFNAIV